MDKLGVRYKMLIPFDLKISRLYGEKWERKDNKKLARQLLEKQGSYRHSIENRLYIIFDDSLNSDIHLFQINENIMLEKFRVSCLDPKKFWFYLKEYNVWQCIIWIRRGEYKQEIIDYNEKHHDLGLGLREEEKANFSHEFLMKAQKIVNCLTINQNIKEKGIDGWLELDIEKPIKYFIKKLG